jgi:hypothetical protein
MEYRNARTSHRLNSVRHSLCEHGDRSLLPLWEKDRMRETGIRLYLSLDTLSLALSPQGRGADLGGTVPSQNLCRMLFPPTKEGEDDAIHHRS